MVELDLSNYATKSDIKKCKSNVDKLKTVPIHLSKLSDVVNNNVVKKTVHDELVKKVNTIDSDKQSLKRKIETVHKKIPDSSKFIVT